MRTTTVLLTVLILPLTALGAPAPIPSEVASGPTTRSRAKTQAAAQPATSTSATPSQHTGQHHGQQAPIPSSSIHRGEHQGSAGEDMHHGGEGHHAPSADSGSISSSLSPPPSSLSEFSTGSGHHEHVDKGKKPDLERQDSVAELIEFNNILLMEAKLLGKGSLKEIFAELLKELGTGNLEESKEFVRKILSSEWKRQTKEYKKRNESLPYAPTNIDDSDDNNPWKVDRASQATTPETARIMGSGQFVGPVSRAREEGSPREPTPETRRLIEQEAGAIVTLETVRSENEGLRQRTSSFALPPHPHRAPTTVKPRSRQVDLDLVFDALHFENNMYIRQLDDAYNYQRSLQEDRSFKEAQQMDMFKLLQHNARLRNQGMKVPPGSGFQPHQFGNHALEAPGNLQIIHHHAPALVKASPSASMDESYDSESNSDLEMRKLSRTPSNVEPLFASYELRGLPAGYLERYAYQTRFEVLMLLGEVLHKEDSKGRLKMNEVYLKWICAVAAAKTPEPQLEMVDNHNYSEHPQPQLSEEQLNDIFKGTKAVDPRYGAVRNAVLEIFKHSRDMGEAHAITPESSEDEAGWTGKRGKNTDSSAGTPPPNLKKTKIEPSASPEPKWIKKES